MHARRRAHAHALTGCENKVSSSTADMKCAYCSTAHASARHFGLELALVVFRKSPTRTRAGRIVGLVLTNIGRGCWLSIGWSRAARRRRRRRRVGRVVAVVNTATFLIPGVVGLTGYKASPGRGKTSVFSPKPRLLSTLLSDSPVAPPAQCGDGPRG